MDSESLFKKLESVNEYSIDYDIPDDEHTLNVMVKIIEMIEDKIPN